MTAINVPIEQLFALLPMPRLTHTGNIQEEEIRAAVLSVLCAVRPQFAGDERRKLPRYPFPIPFYVTPLTDSGIALSDETVVVIGRQIAELGVDFYSRDAISASRVICTFEVGPTSWVAMMLDLSWTKFAKTGFYECGGRFLRRVESPLAELEPLYGSLQSEFEMALQG